MHHGFKSNAIQEGRLFLPHTSITLLVIRSVYKDYVWIFYTSLHVQTNDKMRQLDCLILYRSYKCYRKELAA